MMNETILVTHASCTGSTAEIAESIRNTLSQKGAHVELLRVQDVKDLSPYRAVIVGSPIRKSKWLPEAMQFLRTYRAELAQKRVATFTVCITLAMSTGEQYRTAVREWIAPVRSQVTPISEGLFAGKLDFSRLPWTLDTLLFRITIALGILPKGDRRDWNSIRAWTEGLHSLLLS